MNFGSWRREIFDRIFGAILMILGAAMCVPGCYLAALDGSPYYALAGILIAVAGSMVWQGKSFGIHLYLIVVGLTFIWAFWESGLNILALIPRISVITILSIPLLMFRTPLLNWLSSIAIQFVRWRSVAVVACLVVALGVLMVLNKEGTSPSDRETISQLSSPDVNWTVIGANAEAQRYSPLSQITPSNVGSLQIAWKVHVGMPRDGMIGALQATPLKVGDALYLCNMSNEVISIDAETGKERWRFDPKIDRRGIVMAVCRGLTYVTAPSRQAFCRERVVLTTHDGRMIALDIQSGKLCPNFGDNGQVDVTQGMGPIARGYYSLTSPATLVRGKLVVGGAVLDNQMTQEPSGAIRAFDAINGEFSWAWDMGRQGKHGLPDPSENFTPGTPNAWAPMTADDQRGLVFVPLGNPTPDYVTTHRTPEMLKYGSSIVAIDAETGNLRWSFQTTHRDVWDYDNAAPPTLIDFPTSDGLRPAVVQATKRGELFILDRVTGKPLVTTVELPVPQASIPGEKLSPTQPFSVGMPTFSPPPLTEEKMWGVSPLDHLWCRIKFREARYEGIFTPVSLKPTIVYPGYFGGINWSGVSVDPVRKILIVNVNNFPMYNQMIPRKDADPETFRPFKAGVHKLDPKHWPQIGTPYAIKTGGFLSPIGVPCHQPPYGEIGAIDLSSRKLLWRKPLGTSRDSGPFGIRSRLPINMGSPNLGGSMVTASGLVFIAATQEHRFRAFNTRTGKILWQTRLLTGGHANPMSYFSSRSKRQFVVIAASGHPQLSNGKGDYLIAYALPRVRTR